MQRCKLLPTKLFMVKNDWVSKIHLIVTELKLISYQTLFYIHYYIAEY